MSTKEERAAEARKHIGTMKGIFEKEIIDSAERTVLYEDGIGRNLDIPEPENESTHAVIAWKPLPKALAEASGKVCVVDPAHFTRPAGGYFNGSKDPESQLCMESNLAPILEKLNDSFYLKNKQGSRGGLNSDHAAYIPDVIFTTDGIMRKCDVLVISPVNRRMALENNRSEAECGIDMSYRIEALMRIGAANAAQTLIVNDFGCGYFGNDIKIVASMFSAWLNEHPGIFKKVVFAIPGGPSLDAFKEFFPLEEKESQDELRPVLNDDEDDSEEWEIDVEPVSDGRWVFE